MGILHCFHFYQDNDSKHKARKVQEWLLYNFPKQIQTPAQSPHINPIENLWDELDLKVHTTPISLLTELRRCSQDEWEKLSLEYLCKILEKMPNRLRSVIKHKGNPT